MCIYTAVSYRACGCVGFHHRESEACACRPHNLVRALTVEFGSREPHSQLNIQRRFDEAFSRPTRHLVEPARVFAPIPPGRKIMVAADSNAQACRQSKLQIGTLVQREGQCNKCLMAGVQLRPQEKSIMLFQGDPSVIRDLMAEFGHFNSIRPKEIIRLGNEQERLLHTRRFQAAKRMIKGQNTAIEAELLKRQKLELKKGLAPSDVLGGQKDDPVLLLKPDVKWDEWLVAEVIEGWEEEGEGPKAMDHTDEGSFHPDLKSTGVKRSAATLTNRDDGVKRVRRERLSGRVFLWP